MGVLGKEGKQQRRSEQVKRESARAQRDNRRWKRVLAKMSAERKVAYQGVGNLGKKGRTRGVTRRSQAERKGKREDTTAMESRSTWPSSSRAARSRSAPRW